MRIQRSVQVLTVVTTLGAVAACSSMGGRREARNEPDPNYSSSTVAVVWDSGPLDQQYHQQRTEMDTRHSQELASPRADESSDQRGARHASENQDLERRYAQGKASHAKELPPSDGQGRDNGNGHQ